MISLRVTSFPTDPYAYTEAIHATFCAGFQEARCSKLQKITQRSALSLSARQPTCVTSSRTNWSTRARCVRLSRLGILSQRRKDYSSALRACIAWIAPLRRSASYSTLYTTSSLLVGGPRRPLVHGRGWLARRPQDRFDTWTGANAPTDLDKQYLTERARRSGVACAHFAIFPLHKGP